MNKYHFMGRSFAANHLREAAYKRGLEIVNTPVEADLVFVSEDTKTDKDGKRDYGIIEQLIIVAQAAKKPFVLTSQVEPGFCRKHGVLYHQAETLRILDAEERAYNPEQFIVGTCSLTIPEIYEDYLESFGCPIRFVSLEEAEFAKLAINYFLAKQVETTNELAERAILSGADWVKISNILRTDKRIGPFAYLRPGRWRESIHLLRDYVTLNEIKAFK